MALCFLLDIELSLIYHFTMLLFTCKDENTWVTEINNWLRTQKEKYNFQSLFLPAGETPVPLYKNWEVTRPDFLDGCQFLQIDEILTGLKKSIFQKFFLQHLPSYQDQFVWIDRADQVADLCLLGLGTNGHVAFHEPGVRSDFYSGCLRLNTETEERLKTGSDTRVVTYGVGAFMQSKAILLLVRGASKAQILQTVIHKKMNTPAAELLLHKNFSIFYQP